MALARHRGWLPDRYRVAAAHSTASVFCIRPLRSQVRTIHHTSRCKARGKEACELPTPAGDAAMTPSNRPTADQAAQHMAEQRCSRQPVVLHTHTQAGITKGRLHAGASAIAAPQVFDWEQEQNKLCLQSCDDIHKQTNTRQTRCAWCCHSSTTIQWVSPKRVQGQRR